MNCQVNHIDKKKEDVFKEEILRDFKRKNKKYKKDKLGIQLIYWVSFDKDELSCEKKNFVENIHFNTPTLQKIKLNQIDKKEDIVLSSIITKENEALSDYSEGKIFYDSSKFTQNLLDEIIANNAISVYHLVNFNKHNPYILINENNEVLVYFDIVEEDGSVNYRIIPCEEYRIQINN